MNLTTLTRVHKLWLFLALCVAVLVFYCVLCALPLEINSSPTFHLIKSTPVTLKVNFGFKWKQILFTLSLLAVIRFHKEHFQVCVTLFITVKGRFEKLRPIPTRPWAFYLYIAFFIVATLVYFGIYTRKLLQVSASQNSKGKSLRWQGIFVASPYFGHVILLHIVILTGFVTWYMEKIGRFFNALAAASKARTVK